MALNEKRTWLESAGKYVFNVLPKKHDVLPKGVYELKFNPEAGHYYLEGLFRKFILPEKIYDTEDNLVERVVHSFKTLNKSLGVALKGLKGTGKTIVAKTIANKLDLPVIFVNTPFPDLSFLNEIEQDIVIIFDEFEKTYHGDRDENIEVKIKGLLTLMDGVFTSEYKKLFIITSNDTVLPTPLASRPSRIRYVKDFSQLPSNLIVEMLNDLVKNKELIPKILEYLEDLSVVTIDVVKTMAEEVNLYNSADVNFLNLLNSEKINKRYELYEMKSNGKLVLSVPLIHIWNLAVGRCFQPMNGAGIATITKVDFKAMVLEAVIDDSNKIILYAIKAIPVTNTVFGGTFVPGLDD